MNRSAKFWVLLGVFQVVFGFAVFAVTRDYYQVEQPTQPSQARGIEIGAEPAGGFSSIDPGLLDTVGSDTAFPQDPAEISRRANEAFADRQYPRAAALYEKLLTFEPTNADTLNNLGLTLQYLGRSDEALARLNEGIAADPEYQRIWLTLGFVNSSIGDIDAARDALNTAVTKNPDNEVGRAAARMLDEL